MSEQDVVTKSREERDEDDELERILKLSLTEKWISYTEIALYKGVYDETGFPVVGSAAYLWILDPEVKKKGILLALGLKNFCKNSSILFNREH